MSEFIEFDDETQGLIDLGLEALSRSRVAMQAAWGFGRTKRWDVDTSAGALTFTSPGLVASAAVQFVGTRQAADDSWIWAWANPDIGRLQARLALQVRKYGDQRDLGYLYTPQIYCSEQDGWALTALAFQLSGGKGGAYRGPIGDLAVFMIFDEPDVHRGPLL